MSFVVIVPPEQASDYQSATGTRLRIESAPVGGGAIARWRWEQTGLRRLLHRESIDLLISLGNFALRGSPVPQILFNRNDLYFSPDFVRDLLVRREWKMLALHLIKSGMTRASIREVEINIAPTNAFAAKIARVGSRRCRVEVAPFGVDPQAFDEEPGQEPAITPAGNERFRLLYVSHYNYFRNFETLLRAMPLISEQVRRQTGRDIELVLTTVIGEGIVHGGYDSSRAARLIEQLGIRDSIVMLGQVPYRRMRPLYQSCDLFVSPSYSESFGHPLLEAMSMGLPVLSADLPVHREIGADAAAWFPVFDHVSLAREASQLLADPLRRGQMAAAGLRRAMKFTWDQHVRILISLIDSTAGEG